MTYIIMGPQGSGKGTQAKLLVEEFGVEHVSVGDILRKEVASGSETGKIIKSYMLEGKLVPAKINNDLVKKEVERNPKLLLDGYPRNMEQAEFLLDITKVDCVISINISVEETIKRLSKRLICTANNKILIEDQVTEEDRKECEALGGKIIKREDDEPVAIKKRLQIYQEHTHPLIDLFNEKDVPIISIDGEKSVEEIFDEIKQKANSFFNK